MEFIPLASSSKGNAYLVQEGELLLLLDAGLSLKQIRRASGFLLHRLSGCLVTHQHQDHCRGMLGLAKAGVKIWCTDATWESLGEKRHGWDHKHHKVCSHYDVLSCPPWKAASFPSIHDCEGGVNYLVGSPAGDKLLYATDTGYIRERFHGLTHVAIECNWSRETLDPSTTPERLSRLEKFHLSLEDVLGFLAANDLSRCREIHLLHLSSSNSDAGLFQRKVREATGITTRVALEFAPITEEEVQT
jgi:phosphoribosyl 1,2-cyclic phosphodiesterase